MEKGLQKTIKDVLNQSNIKARFEEILGKKAQGFISSVMNVVNSNNQLKQADPQSILNSAVVAATLDLPIDPNLGFAAIVPYNAKQKDGQYKQVAQFQMMYKGFIQLAQRSGQYESINVAPMYQGELKKYDRITENIDIDYDSKESDVVIGYVGYFKLLNGFQKLRYWTIEEIDKHGKRFSKTYQKGYGLWADKEKGGFEAMAMKTVLKNLLSKYGILSIEMQSAIKFDQGVINDIETENVEYIDNNQAEEKIEKIEAMTSDQKQLKLDENAG